MGTWGEGVAVMRPAEGLRDYKTTIQVAAKGHLMKKNMTII